MEIFKNIAVENHEQVVFWRDKVADLRAIIAIHDTTLGPAIGGVRLLHYDTEDDAVHDALRLSRAMTYKASAVGVNFGGGQAVILSPDDVVDKDALWWSFGRFVNSLGGRFIAGEDVGTSVVDMEMARQETEYVVGISHALGGGGDPGPVSAHGVYSGLLAGVKEIYNKSDLSGLRVAIQGLGHVGYALASELKSAGAEVFASDIDGEKAQTAKNELGIELVEPDEIFDVGVDIFSPCALGGVINKNTISSLKCKIIGGSANNQLESDDLGRELHVRGITYLPDFIIGAGGLINVCNEIEGYDQVRAFSQASNIAAKIKRIIEISEEDNVPTLEAAMVLARQRLDRVKRLRGLI